MVYKSFKTTGIILPLIIGILFLAFSAPKYIQTYTNRGPGIDTLLKNKNKREYLEMSGVVRQSRKTDKGNEIPLDSAVISVYHIDNKLRNKLIDFYTNKRGKCSFRLPLNGKYMIVIGKTGFVAKSIQVNTKVPEHKKTAYLFRFSVDIFADIKGLDASMLEKPIADIAYVFTKDNFDYDLAYTNKVRKDLAEMYKNLFILNKMQKDTVQALPQATDTVEQH